MKKRILSFVLAISILSTLFTVLPITTSAATSDIYTYQISNNKVTITYCKTSASTVEIPEFIEGYPVTNIKKTAFSSCKNLSSINISKYVSSIELPIMYCPSLSSITVDVNNSFYSSDNFGVLYNKDKTMLLYHPAGNIRNSYEIPNGVNIIGEFAFNSSQNLKNITIPNSVTSIEFNAFGSCTSLTNVRIPDSITTIGESAFSSCSSLQTVTIPNSVSTIGISAFSHCERLLEIDIPDSVTYLGKSAFSQCKRLINISIGNSVRSIEQSTFRHCSNLSTVTIGNKVTSIGDYAFDNCGSLTHITIPNNVTTIGKSAFSSCSSLQTVTIPNSVSTISQSAFNYCTKLKNITIPNSVNSIGDYAFRGCTSLACINIPNSVTSIGDSAFSGCTGLTNINIPDSVTYIGYEAFYHCTKLTNINIPDSVTSIYHYAFRGCTSLACINIPNSVTSIGDSAFGDCTSLTRIAVNANNPNYSSLDGVLFNKNKTALIQYPIGNDRETYTIPDNVTSIGGGAFSGCDNLTSVTLSNSVTSIGNLTFEYCSRLTSITLPNSVTSIGWSAFDDCFRLTDVYYTGSEEDWSKISIGSSNSYLTNATIHYNYKPAGSGSVYEPTEDIEITSKVDPEYMPDGINNVTINGKGTAYGRFKILKTDGSIAKNKNVNYSIDGGAKGSTKTDEYGYAVIEIPNIIKSHDYSFAFSGDEISPASDVLKVTVIPLRFKSGFETIIEKGVSAGIGLEAKAEIGSLEASAGVASGEVSGTAKNTFALDVEAADNKYKVSASSKSDYDAALKAKIGLFASAKEKNVGGISISAAEGSAGGSIGGTFGVSYEDEDFSLKNSNDIENLSRFLLSALVGSQAGNVVAAFVAESLDAPVNAYELGTVLKVDAGAKLAGVELGDDNVSGGFTIGGINTNSIWSYNTELMADSSIAYSSGVTVGKGSAMFNRDVKFKAKKASTGGTIDTKNFVKESLSVSAERDPDFKLKTVALSSKGVEDSSKFLYNKSTSETDTIIYEDEVAERVAASYDKLNAFTNGSKALFSKKQLQTVLDTMTSSNEIGKYAVTKSFEEGLALDLSATLALGFKLGGKIGIAGSSSYSYETENGIYANGTYYKQSENQSGKQIEQGIITIDDIVSSVKSHVSDFLDSIWETVKGATDQAVEYGKAAVKKAANKITGWAISITKPKTSVKTMSILAVEDEISLFSTASLATTIGDPYIISVTDESGNEVTDFSANPFVLTLTYTDAQLAEAGVTDLDNISIMRWDDDKNTYVKMGGTLDEENSCLTLEILKPGQYILAVDNRPPAITQFVTNGSGNNPEISAVVSDMSGIDDFTFKLDGSTMLSKDNFEENYNHTTGEFLYKTSNLTDGEHKATIYAKDTFGNEIEEEITFNVDTSTPEISNVTAIPEIISGDVYVSANVENANIVLLNMEVADVYGKAVQYSVDMTEDGGAYTAKLPNAENGSSVKVWVSAYSKAGNGSASEKQSAVVMKSQDNAPMVAITNIVDNNVSVKCVGFDSNENATVYLALYDDNGALLQVKSQKFAENITFTDIAKSGYIKAFVWENMTPLSGGTQMCEFVRFVGTKTSVSEDGKAFTVKPVAIDSGDTVILALYNGDILVELQENTYQSAPISFTTTEAYTNAKVMVWKDLSSAIPSCSVEIVK